MCFAGGKTLLHFSPLLLLILLLSVLQIWVCSQPSSRLLVGAIRILPENAGAKVKPRHTTTVNAASAAASADKNRFFQKYPFFLGTTSNNITSHDKGFEETKRRVPSCPDPLHN